MQMQIILFTNDYSLYSFQYLEWKSLAIYLILENLGLPFIQICVKMIVPEE